jgi:hypothetical protein
LADSPLAFLKELREAKVQTSISLSLHFNETGVLFERHLRLEPYCSPGAEGVTSGVVAEEVSAAGVVVGAVSAEGVTVVVSSVVEEDDSW